MKNSFLWTESGNLVDFVNGSLQKLLADVAELGLLRWSAVFKQLRQPSILSASLHFTCLFCLVLEKTDASMTQELHLEPVSERSPSHQQPFVIRVFLTPWGHEQDPGLPSHTLRWCCLIHSHDEVS